MYCLTKVYIWIFGKFRLDVGTPTKEIFGWKKVGFLLIWLKFE
jgi:hypothetical protein